MRSTAQPPKLTAKQVKDAQKQRNKRISVRTLAKALKVSAATIYNHTMGPSRTRNKTKR